MQMSTGYASKSRMRALKHADKLERKWVEERIAREQEARKNKQKARWLDVAFTIITTLMSILTLPEGADGFRAHDCNNASNPVDHYSLLEPGPCPHVMKTYQLERTLKGEIVQMKKERLQPVVRCHVVETIQSQYCWWQSWAGVTRILKFREPYIIEPAACRNAVKTGMLMIGGVKCNFTLGVTTSFTTHLKGSLDNAHWCTRETYQDGIENLPMRQRQLCIK